MNTHTGEKWRNTKRCATKRKNGGKPRKYLLGTQQKTGEKPLKIDFYSILKPMKKLPEFRWLQHPANTPQNAAPQPPQENRHTRTPSHRTQAGEPLSDPTPGENRKTDHPAPPQKPPPPPHKTATNHPRQNDALHAGATVCNASKIKMHISPNDSNRTCNPA